MKTFLLLFALCLIPLAAKAADSAVVVANVESIEQGKLVSMKWTAPASQIAALPAWKPDAGKFPLAMDDAIQMARRQLAQSFPAIKEWKLDEISLNQIKNNGNSLPILEGKYYYLVFVVPARDEDAEPIKKTAKGEMSFYEVILSDGTILTPQTKLGFQ